MRKNLLDGFDGVVAVAEGSESEIKEQIFNKLFHSFTNTPIIVTIYSSTVNYLIPGHAWYSNGRFFTGH